MSDMIPAREPAGTGSGQHNILDVPASWGLTIPVGDYRTSLNETTEDGQRRLYDFLNGSGLAPEAMVNVVVSVVGLSIQPVAKQIDEGVLPLPRLAVHHQNGSYTEFVSPGILKSLGYIIKRKGPPPWDPPLQLKLERFGVGVTPKGAPKYMYRYQLVE